MKRLILSFIAALTYSSASAQPATDSLILGKQLFHNANCAECHFKSGKYDPIVETTQNFKEVRGWVKSCTQYFNIDWFPEEETATTFYINDIYYRYPLAEEE